MKPELLIPANNLEVLKTAVIFGADAVSIGGEAFGLRAKAKNFSPAEMKEACAEWLAGKDDPEASRAAHLRVVHLALAGRRGHQSGRRHLARPHLLGTFSMLCRLRNTSASLRTRFAPSLQRRHP